MGASISLGDVPIINSYRASWPLEDYTGNSLESRDTRLTGREEPAHPRHCSGYMFRLEAFLEFV